MNLDYVRDPRPVEKDFSISFSEKLKPSLKPSILTDIDLSIYATPSNQYNLSACAGNATADAVEIIGAVDEEARALAEGLAARPQPQLSRLFIYSLARSLMDEDHDNQGDINVDAGVYIRLCFEVLSRFGICTEDLWPYDPTKVYVSPSLMAMRQAVGHRIHSYYRITESGDDRLEAIVAALRGKHPVVFGTSIDAAFQITSGADVIDRPTGNIVGAHAMIIVGYQNGLFKVKNSWGSHWRGDGYCYFTPAYLAWEETWDLWVPTSGTVFE